METLPCSLVNNSWFVPKNVQVAAAKKCVKFSNDFSLEEMRKTYGKVFSKPNLAKYYNVHVYSVERKISKKRDGNVKQAFKQV